jgi:flagellin
MQRGITEDAMSRINTNISSIQSIHQLIANQKDLALRLERLSSGLRINRGKDDPAGLIASESLRSELTGINQAIENSSRAINVLSVGDAALGEVSALLLEVRGLINASANDGALSQTEIEANQLQVDSLLESIDRIAGTTQFNGEKLLNGNLEYVLSGVTTSQISNTRIYGARVPEGASLTVTVQVINSAETGQLTYVGTALSAGNNLTIEVTGVLGSEQFSFASGTVVSAMAAAINSFSDLTGVSAALNANQSAFTFHSVTYGSESFVRVQVIQTGGDFVLYNENGEAKYQDYGVDAGVLINGQIANSNGLIARARNNGLDVELELAPGFGTRLLTSTFAITGGGARFQIGPDVNSNGQVSVGIPSASTASLGDNTVGFLSQIGGSGEYSIAGGNYSRAERIVKTAIEQVSVLRGRLGGLQANQLETNINSQQVAYENVKASESAIRDTDYASEVADLTRAQILVQATTTVLSIANQLPQNVLALLR